MKELKISDYPFKIDIQTRWHDNDIYGHVNNVTYYAYFDTTVNRYLIEHGGLDIHKGNQIGFMVSSECQYYAAVEYPQTLVCGLRILHLGNTSVQYGLGLFNKDNKQLCAEGKLTHVFVERDTQKPKAIQGQLREALSQLLTAT